MQPHPIKPTYKTKCTVCLSGDLCITLSFGEQPVSNRFFSKADTQDVRADHYPLSLGYCRQCGTIQLVDRMPIEAIRPRYDWLRYNEPERHLDDLARSLGALPEIDLSSPILGITYKDQSTLYRMNKLGFINTKCIEENHLDHPEKPLGLETIQHILSNDSTTTKLRSLFGRSDMLLVRHIIEHTPNATRLIRSLKRLLKPNGYMICELPDCERFLQLGNHPFVWEEHISYFTETSIKQLAKAVDAEVVWLKRYRYPYEDSLVIALQFTNSTAHDHCPDPSPQESVALLNGFSNAMLSAQNAWHQKISALRSNGEKVAVFGAGHLAVKLINFYGLTKWIDYVVDDHPDKIGLLMPGSHLPIISSAELVSNGIHTCISTLNPESEIKVRNKLIDFFDAGGCFIPAFITN